MEVRYLPDPNSYSRLTTSELRAGFLVDEIFKPGKINLLYTNADRGIVGSAMPFGDNLTLEASRQEMAADYFSERRELGIINIGKSGTVTVDGKIYSMDYHDGLYIGKGVRELQFSSDNSDDSAAFYLLSYPAHTTYPTKHLKFSAGETNRLGTAEQANERTITKLIAPGLIESCQLVMGVTELKPGSVWNTMAAHIHPRRTEIYMYYNLGEDERIFHLFGKPDETRHLILRNQQAVISPSWSMHSGVATANYSFIWGMGGENQAFDDMDFIAMDELK